MVEIVEHAIDAGEVAASVLSPQAGGVVLFLGVTREVTNARRTHKLAYECYREMALAKLAELEAEARRRWPVVHCTIVHRVGEVFPGEPSVAVAVSTPHRAAAFEAGEWLIDTLKQVVPIWKQEFWSDGAVEWVHPGLGEAPSNSVAHDCH